MSGNPFRVGNAKSNKHVQILSPDTSHSPRLARHVSHGLTGSPPPAVRSNAEDDEDTSEDDGEVTRQGAMNSAPDAPSLPPPPTAFGIQPTATRGAIGTKAPSNPFARTLATSEAALGRDATRNDAGADLQHTAPLQPARPTLDVDQFKDILLNGSALGSSSRPKDNSPANTSSTTQQESLFHSFAHSSESPRASWDHDRSYSDEETDDGDESTTLMSPTEDMRLDTLAPPAPPKQKHARPHPQTVSFADFDESIPSGFSKPMTPPISTQHLAGILRPQLHKSRSDLNKPLPQLPPTLQLPVVTTPFASDLPPLTIPVSEEQSFPVKSAPPPPPTSRRQGQINTMPTSPRDASNSSQPSPSQPEVVVNPLEPTTERSPAAAPPPPPPTRRAQQTSLVVAEPAQIPQSSPSPKNIPPPPPRRAVSKTGSSIARTSSNASSRISADAAALAPPPPPPRRDRGSKRNSLDGVATRRSSDQRDPREDGEHSLPNNSRGEVGEPKDVLANLDALQAEIDALRARSKGD